MKSTWKIFLNIMFMVSLTFISVNSSDAGEDSSSDAGEGSSLNPPERIKPSLYTIDTLTGEQWYSGIKIYNPFDAQTQPIAYECHAQIRPYCHTLLYIVTSNHCARDGMVSYSKNLQDVHANVHEFFNSLPLNAENIDLPDTFCETRDKKCNKNIDLPDTICETRVNECKIELAEYSAEVIHVGDERDKVDAVRVSRLNVAKFALLNKLLDAVPEDKTIEKEYLIDISDKIKSADEVHTPHTFCNRKQLRINSQRLRRSRR